MTRRRLRVYGTIFALLQLCGVFGYCHCLRLDLHDPFSFSEGLRDPRGLAEFSTVIIDREKLSRKRRKDALCSVFRLFHRGTEDTEFAQRRSYSVNHDANTQTQVILPRARNKKGVPTV